MRLCGSAVAGGDDVRLYGVLGGVGRIAGDHGALVEGAGAEVGAAAGLAAVAAAAQDDRALLLHRAVPAGQSAVPQRGQAAGLCVAALDGEPRGAVVLQHRGDELAREGALVGVPGLAATGVQAPFEVRLDPGAGAGAAAEPALGAEVDRVHGTGGVGLAVGLAVAVVEAAAAVDVGAAGDHVHALRCGAGRHARQVAVAPVAVAGVDVQRVRLAAADRQRLGGRVRRAALARAGHRADPWYHRSLPCPDWS